MLDQLLDKIVFDHIDGGLFDLVQVDLSVDNLFQYVSSVLCLAITPGVFIFRFYLTTLVKKAPSTVFDEGHTKQLPYRSSPFHISSKELRTKIAS